GAVSIWIDAYARDPSHFLVLGLMVVGLIWLGVRLGGKVEDRMERVWRKFVSAQLSIGNFLSGLLFASIVVYAIGHSHVPASCPGHAFLNDHITTPVAAILVCILIALFTPPGLVRHLRGFMPYRYFVHSIKLVILPFLFA